jgi:hypothetical protein
MRPDRAAHNRAAFFMPKRRHQRRAEATMAAPKGNQFWKARSTPCGRPIFDSPDKLWQSCIQYFEWVDANPLLEDTLVTFQGTAHHEPVAKMRAMTIAGLCIFLDIGRQTWVDYTKRDEFRDVCHRVEEIIRTQKFEGASADLLNQAIIARELGLADKTELTGRDGAPLQVQRIERVIVDPANRDA